MKYKIFSLICAVAFFCAVSPQLTAVDMNIPIQKSVAKGQYIPDIDVTIKDLRSLPVPLANENYAILQSIDTVTNIIIGNFASGEREIILIKDKNGDGEVDLVAHWFVDGEKFKFDASPSTSYSSAAFAKMKEDIISGTRGTVFPNPDGVEVIRMLYQNSDNVQKWRTGYLVTRHDPDNPAREISRYSYSLSADGADLAFEIFYYPRGTNRVSPVINQSVYCKKSKDKVALETVKKLIEETNRISPF